MFSSRIDAGQRLGKELLKRRLDADVVLGIPRGGVVVAFEIAQILKLPLDVLVVKKLGAPNNAELAIGALTHDDVTYIDPTFTHLYDNMYLRHEVRLKHHAVAERENMLRPGRPLPDVSKKRVIIADDGAATGATLFAAIEWTKKQKAARIIVVLPVAATETIEKIKSKVDECVILESPIHFTAVGEFYKDFREVRDEEVVHILKDKSLK